MPLESPQARMANYHLEHQLGGLKHPTPPIVAYPDYEKPFIVHTDACKEGLGAALYQRQDGKIRVIAYASRTLTPAEKLPSPCWKIRISCSKMGNYRAISRLPVLCA